MVAPRYLAADTLSNSVKERADLLAVVCDVYCDVGIFPFGILGQVWYLIVSIPDLCCLSNSVKEIFGVGGGGGGWYGSLQSGNM